MQQRRTIAMEEPPADPSIAKALDKVDQVVARLQQLQSTISITRHAVSSSASPKFQAATLRSDKKCNTSTAGEWKQWSAPAELLHRTLCDILAAAKSVTQISGGALDVSDAEVEELQFEPREEEEEEAAVVAKGKCGNNNKSELLDEVEQSKFVTKPATCMQVSKVKESQKAWKLPQKRSKDAVMFPNVAYSPASPPKQFRILTPFKTRPSAKPQKVPLLGGKKKSPVHSLPTLIDRLPSKPRPGAAEKKQAGAASIASCRSKELLPYPPSHYAQAERVRRESRSTSKKAPGRKPPDSTPFKPLGCNDDGAFNSASRGRSGRQQQQYVKLSSGENDDLSPRARSISPRRRKRSDKENLLTPDAGGGMRRSWSAGSASAFGAKNNNLGGHSMLQRAKGWVLGKQQHGKATRF